MRALAAIAFALPVTAAATLPAIPPDVARSISALDCLSVSATDVERTLARFNARYLPLTPALCPYSEEREKVSASLPWRPRRNSSFQTARTCYARRAMLLVIDNYDSFTYNIVQYLLKVSACISVARLQ